jgi:hypothetical protein
MIRDRIVALAALVALASGCSSHPCPTCSDCASSCTTCCASDAPAPKPSAPKDGSKALFDGRSLKNWKVTEYGGQGEVEITKGGELSVAMGAALSGVTWAGEPLPKTNYEITLEALKVDGDDIFCGICFPVGDAFCSFVCGGWGGQIVGLSCVDDMMADGNDTTKVMEFKKDQWYRLRLRVTPEKIQTWVYHWSFPAEKLMADQEIKDHKISLHPAMEDAKPFGIATYTTTSQFRNITLKKLP